MDIRISANDGLPIYQQIVNQMKYLVASGRLTPGEELPQYALEHRPVEGFLAVVVVVEQCRVHRRLLSDLLDGRRGEALSSEEPLGGVENRVLG